MRFTIQKTTFSEIPYNHSCGPLWSHKLCTTRHGPHEFSTTSYATRHRPHEFYVANCAPRYGHTKFYSQHNQLGLYNRTNLVRAHVQFESAPLYKDGSPRHKKMNNSVSEQS